MYSCSVFRCQQLEHDSLNLTVERSRLETDYATATQRIESLERSSLEAESDSTELRRGLDGLKEQLEREREWARDQEAEGKRVRLDKASVDKENRKFKQILVGKDEKVEELCTKIRELEKISRGGKRNVVHFNCCRISRCSRLCNRY